MNLRFAASALFSFLVFLSSSLGLSRVIEVTTLDDVIDAGACGLITYADLPGADNQISLREAICVAENEAGQDYITFRPGLSGTISLGIPFDTIDNGDLEIIGPGIDVIEINGGLAHRLFRVANGVTVRIAGLTLNAGGGDLDGGGAILINNATVTVERCQVIHSKAIANGGGIHNVGGTVNLVDSEIDTCNTDGGGLNGGGIANTNSGTLTVLRSRIINNKSLAPNCTGAGIYNDSGTVTIIDSVISGNEVSSAGGGIYSNNELTIRRSTIADNFAADDSGGGGGLWIAGGTASAVNTTFSGNRTNGFGGGVFGGLGTADFINCTFAYNVGNANNAGLGGGGAMGQLAGSLQIGNCLFAENEDAIVQNYNIPGGVVSLGHNFIQNVGSANFANNTTGDIYGDPLNTTTPDAGAFESPVSIVSFLLPLQDNGGLTPMHALLPNSDCIDAGDDALVANPPFDGPPFTDQRGADFERIFDGDNAGGATVDIGAYEYQIDGTPPIVVSTVDDNDDGQVGPGELSLREAVALAPFGATIAFDEVVFAPGSTKTIKLGASGESSAIIIDKPLQIIAPEAMNVILDGEEDNQIFRITPSGALLLFNVTLINGFAPALSGGGGAVLAEENFVAINCVFMNNKSEENGGAVRMRSGVVTGTFGNCRFEGNSTTVSGADGGAVAIDTGADGHFTQCDFIGNDTVLAAPSNGGAIYVHGANSSARLTRCNVAQNEAASDGGGIYAESDAELQIDQSAIYGNTAESNSASAGGVEFTGGAHGFIRNSTISGNITNGHGGGVVVFGSVIGVTMEHVTIVNNVCDYDNNDTGDGGGLYQVGGTLEISHCLIADNIDISGQHPDVQGSNITSMGYNLIGNVGGMNFSSNTTGDLYGDPDGTTTANAGATEFPTPIDPMIGNLQNNGGGTPTVALLQGSPAIDAGDPASAVVEDQRDAARPLDGNGDLTFVVDIGAFESNGGPNPVILVSTTDDNDDGNLTWGELSLREAIGIAPPGATIMFAEDLDGVIFLGPGGMNSNIHINNPLNIIGPPDQSISISGQNSVGIFVVAQDIDVELHTLIFYNGNAANGGAILTGGNLTVSNCRFSSNGTSGRGAAIYNFGDVSVYDSVFAGNVCSSLNFNDGGGAIYNTDDTGNGATAHVERCIVFQNGGPEISGGAFSNRGDTGEINDAVMTIVNSTLIGNQARFGGAISTAASDSLTNIRHCTIIDNEAFENAGGIIRQNGTINIQNSILHNNTSPNDDDLNGIFYIDYSLIGNPGSALIVGGNNIIGQDPMLESVPLLASIAHRSPLSGSPAIDAADPNKFEIEDGRKAMRATDGDGNGSRLPDMGAIEIVPIVRVDPINGSDEFDGTQWNVDGTAGPVKSIQQGVELATYGGEVWLRQGVHQPAETTDILAFISLRNIAVRMKSGVGVYGGFAGTETTRGQRSQDPNLTIIDGSIANQGQPANHVVSMHFVSNAILDGVTVTGGAANGGGIETIGGGLAVRDNDDPCIVSNCVIRDNTALSYGAGVYCGPGSNVHFVNSTIRNNTSTGSLYGGGGLHAIEATVRLNRCTISNNHANAQGGGIISRASEVWITNSTISGNTTNENGGGIFVLGTAFDIINIDSTTIVNNTGGLGGYYPGGGAYFSQGGTSMIINTLIAGNSDSGAGYPDYAGVFDSDGYNLIGDLGLTVFYDNDTGDQYGDPLGSTTPNAGALESGAAVDPLIGPLADNGGFTFTHELLPGSPAIDAAYPGSTLTHDQRGAFRPSDGNDDNTAISDIGAFEVEDETPDIGFLLAY